MSYPRYDSYKESGVEWLGEIPSHWNLERLKFSAQLRNDKVDASAVNLPYTGLENIESGRGRLIVNGETVEATGTANRFYSDDVLFGKLRPYLAKVFHAENDGICSSELLVLSARTVVPAFLRYYLLSDEFIQIVNSSTYGAKMPRASWDFIGNMPLSLPPLDEQTSIADFLDRETAKIDALIAKQQALIDLLGEKGQALISHTVTKGLNPDAPLRDSGVEWLGEIPVGWEVVKLAFVSRVFNGSTPSRSNMDYWTDGSIGWLASGKANDYYVTTPSEYITQEAQQQAGLTVAPTGSVIMGMIGQGKTRGMSAYIQIPSTINQNLAAIVPTTKLNGRFLHHILMHMYEPIREYGRGGNQEALNTEIVASLRIPLPPILEQEKIANFVDQRTSTIAELVDRANIQIAKLQERRTALISAAVTGKINVA